MYHTELLARLELSGLTVAEFARAVGVTHPAVDFWLAGETLPRHQLMPAIADALGWPVLDQITARVQTQMHRERLRAAAVLGE